MFFGKGASEQVSIFIGQIYYCSYILNKIGIKGLLKYKFFLNPKSTPTDDECSKEQFEYYFRLIISKINQKIIFSNTKFPLYALTVRKPYEATNYSWEEITNIAQMCAKGLLDDSMKKVTEIDLRTHGVFSSTIENRCLVEVRGPHFLTNPKEIYFGGAEKIKNFQSNAENIENLLNDVETQFVNPLIRESSV